MYISTNDTNMLSKTRYNLLPAVFLLYFIPLLVFGVYFAKKSPELSLGVFSFSFGLLSFGSLGFFLLLRSWESFREKQNMALDPILGDSSSYKTVASHQKAQAEAEAKANQIEAGYNELNHLYEQLKIDLKNENQAYLQAQIEKDQLQQHLNRVQEELVQLKESTAEKLEQNQIFLHEHQQTITEQRQVIEAKQQHIQQLEDKVRDLTYEIKTLLHLAEKTQINEIPKQQELFSKPNLPETASLGSPIVERPINGEDEATYQLRRCIDIAQKMTGASHYNRLAKRNELSIEHHALDLRCLFESLKNENTFAIIVYSQKENKLIFANGQIKPLLGWSSEKFIQNFLSIIEESSEAWNNSIAQLAYKNECQTELSLKSKTGSSIQIKCHLGVIPTGIFRSNILGILSHN